MMRSSQLGFTLLEAIVAMTIMAATLIVLYGWLATNATALRRVQDNAALLEDKRSALALLETVNPMETPEGRQQIGPLAITWTSTPITDTRMAITRANLPSAFDVELFDVSIELSRSGSTPTEFRVRRAGWILARPPPLED